MIGRTVLTHFVDDDGSRGACEHLLEVAHKKLREALAQRAAANLVVRKCREEIHRRKAQLRERVHG